MDDEVYSFALKNTLNEVRNICPDITNTFMFKEDGEIIVGDENTPEKTIVRVIDAFDTIMEKAEAIGDVEGITLEGDKGRLNVLHMNELYLAIVTSRKADINYVNTVTRVLIPTVLKLLDKISSPTPRKNNPPLTKREIKTAIVEEDEETSKEFEETATEEVEETIKPEIKSEPEPSLPEPPVNQLIVENLGGLLVPSDTVRIDNKILSEWEELYEGKRIEEVEIETIDGKTTRCKVKTIKESKYEGKGIMQMPEKIQLALEIKKGELVRVKPIVE